MNANSKSLRNNNMLLAFVSLLVAITLIAVVGFFILKPRKEIVQGQVEAKEVRVSGKIPGRILEIRVNEGDRVKAGDTLAILQSPEIEAKLQQALSVQKAAEAQNNKALKGARKEQIDGAFSLWQKAKAGLEIAEKSNHRIQNLFEQGVVSAQKKDEAEANYKAMQATEQAAHSQYQQALNGAEKEDKAAAEALVNQAIGAVEEVNSYLTERYVLAPISGQISEIFPNEGELVGTGMPIFNIMDRENEWVVFNIREDLLKKIRIGAEIKAYVPALDKEIALQVFYMKDMGSYAAWKATKTNGQYDLKTFEIKARPGSTIEGLFPGMSVVIDNLELN